MSEETPLRIGMIVRLKQKRLQAYLKSVPVNYSIGTTSQQVVMVSPDVSPAVEWEIKGPNGAKTTGAESPLKHDDLIRLEHCDTRRNLHTHQRPPVSKSVNEFEVTAFGENGDGNPDDDWRLEIPGEGEWKTGQEFKLVHVIWNTALHAHTTATKDPALTGQDSEVTAFAARDDNDWWVAEVISPHELATQPNSPLVTVDLADNGGIVFFATVEAAEQWWLAERKATEWLRGMTTPTAKRILGDVEAVDRSLALAAGSPPSTARAWRAWQALGWQLKKRYGEERLRHSCTPIGRFIGSLAERNRELALGALIYYAHGEEANNTLVAGICRAVLFDQGLDGLEVHRQNLTELHAYWQKNLDALARAGDEKCRQLEDVRQSYFEKMAFQAPVTYWQDKARLHSKQRARFAKCFFWTALVAFLVFSGVAIFVLWGDKPSPWKITVLVAVAVPLIWALRMLARFLLSNSHLAADADERAVMLQTYLSLLKDPNAMKPEDRQLVLRALFTSTQTGLVVDDAAPATPMDVLTKLKT